jgi:hypothetical protein
VQWTRGPDGIIEVADVCDFGTTPISDIAKHYFGRDEEGDVLPPVDPDLWATRRCVPVPQNHPHLPQTNNDREYVFAVADYVSQLLGPADVDALYGGGAGRPTFLIDGEQVQQNLPAMMPHLDVVDFVLDLGYVYSAVMRTISTVQLQQLAQMPPGAHEA